MLRDEVSIPNVNVDTVSNMETESRTKPNYIAKAGPRNLSIDSLRGIAIILMVAGHVIGGTASDGMQVSENSIWRQSYLLLEDLRMPLFTCLSGFVYAMRPVQGLSSYPAFLKGKTRRLLIPLLAVGTIFVVVQAENNVSQAGC